MFGQDRLQVALKTMGSNRTIKGMMQDQRLAERTFLPFLSPADAEDYSVLEGWSVRIATGSFIHEHH